MDQSFAIFIFFSLLILQSRASDVSSASVFFVDSSIHTYLHHPSSSKVDSISLPEVGAAVSVLLGVAPASMLSDDSSSKLNEVLVPNPFDRPHAVCMLEVSGAEGSQLVINSDNNIFGGALKSRVSDIDSQADIQLPDEDVSVFSLNEDADCSDQELSDFASWLGGSYITDSLKPLNGELVIPMANGANLRFHLTKSADKKFATSLVSFIHNIRKAIKIHQDISRSVYSPSELIVGKFDGIQALKEIYGTEGIAEQGLELFVTSVSKIFNSLQMAYKGEIVGVIICAGESLPDSKSMINVAITSRPSARWLEETKVQANSTRVAEVLLVRKSVAWITGIILLIATVLGVHFLLNMPLTRDTLLYSNVKFD